MCKVYNVYNNISYNNTITLQYLELVEGFRVLSLVVLFTPEGLRKSVIVCWLGIPLMTLITSCPFMQAVSGGAHIRS